MNLVCEVTCVRLTLNLLTTTIVAPPSNASKWQMGFNSAFKGLDGKKRGSEVEMKHGPTRGSFLDDEFGRFLFWREKKGRKRGRRKRVICK